PGFVGSARASIGPTKRWVGSRPLSGEDLVCRGRSDRSLAAPILCSCQYATSMPTYSVASQGREMPLPKSVAPFNKHVTNGITKHFAGWVPGFGIVTHVGRRSGRTYRTPVNVFQHGNKYVVALTYGADTDWVRNVIAAGGCGLETRGRTVRLTDPRLFTDPTRSEVPAFARWALGLMRADDLLELRVRR